MYIIAFHNWSTNIDGEANVVSDDVKYLEASYRSKKNL